jgi:thioredoxin 1
MVQEIESKAGWDKALKDAKDAGNKLVVLDCYATWCGPCRLIAPKVIAFSNDYPDVQFYKLDVDKVSDVAAELGVRAMPTFFFFKDEQMVGDVVGANPSALKAGIEKHR